MSTKLLLVTGDVLGDNCDLFVEAENDLQALALWEEYYEGLFDTDTLTVREVPRANGSPKAFRWDALSSREYRRTGGWKLVE